MYAKFLLETIRKMGQRMPPPPQLWLLFFLIQRYSVKF